MPKPSLANSDEIMINASLPYTQHTSTKQAVQEFYQQINAALVGFPDVLSYILSSLGGAVVSVIVAARVSTVPLSVSDVAGQFVVCWLTGGVLGPTLFAQVIQSVVKLPMFAICFLSSGVGWWFWTKVVTKKQDELLNQKPPDDAGSTP